MAEKLNAIAHWAMVAAIAVCTIVVLDYIAAKPAHTLPNYGCAGVMGETPVLGFEVCKNPY